MSHVLNLMKWGAISIAAILLLLVLFWKPIIHFAFHDLPFQGKSFDGVLWATALDCSNEHDCLDKEFACVRGPMYEDLKSNHLTNGALRPTVIHLIGEPTRAAQNNCIDYELGYCSGIKIDTDYLRVCFDKSEKIKKVYHWQS